MRALSEAFWFFKVVTMLSLTSSNGFSSAGLTSFKCMKTTWVSVILITSEFNKSSFTVGENAAEMNACSDATPAPPARPNNSVVCMTLPVASAAPSSPACASNTCSDNSLAFSRKTVSESNACNSWIMSALTSSNTGMAAALTSFNWIKWKPNWVLIGSDTVLTSIVNRASSNSLTMSSAETQPKSPPLSAEPGSCE